MPQQVQLIDRSLKFIYAADGRKLHMEVQDTKGVYAAYRSYSGNLVFDINDELEYIQIPEGRLLHDKGVYTIEYHLRDHLGNVRVAFTPPFGAGGPAEVVQETTYYTFGAPIGALSWNKSVDNRNPFLREGKEYISEYGWGWYDYLARFYNPLLPVFGGPDQLADQYPWMNPYTAFANNPQRYTDPTGMMMTDYRNEQGELLYKTNDGLTDIIIIPDKNIPKLEVQLEIAKKMGKIDDPITNQESMHVFGSDILVYKDKHITKNQNHDAGFVVGYDKTYHAKSTKATDVLYFGLSFGLEGAEMRTGYNKGKEEGINDRTKGNINILKPFENLSDNPR